MKNEKEKNEFPFYIITEEKTVTTTKASGSRFDAWASLNQKEGQEEKGNDIKHKSFDFLFYARLPTKNTIFVVLLGATTKDHTD